MWDKPASKHLLAALTQSKTILWTLSVAQKSNSSEGCHFQASSTERVHQNNRLLHTAGAERYLKLAGDLI